LLTPIVAPLVALACAPSQDVEAVASDIESFGHPSIQDVRYSPRNFLDPAEIKVLLVVGATEDDAAHVWCEVIVPAGGSDFTEIYNQDGSASMAIGVRC